ncbi:hypothetical protein HUS70_05170 [Pandoraea nosoerga]|uniref:hypothetical protein n=1 Tax=Pandoraea nosoerga TaxID=2508296 RepID=UPI00197F4BAD|nr:hypothetical protein [Pandoraea nosoerga]MBN4744063.1 hypothetical protein [Pandoraea nosoerga]
MRRMVGRLTDRALGIVRRDERVGPKYSNGAVSRVVPVEFAIEFAVDFAVDSDRTRPL